MLPPQDPDFTANMICMVFCAVNLLHHLNLPEYGDLLTEAMLKAVRNTDYLKKDLRGQFKIREFTDSIIHNLRVI